MRKGERTRQLIVETASNLFYQRGYGSTSFSDIVDRAGVQRGNIYHYFKSKEEILGAVIRQRESEYRALLDEWNSTCADPAARLCRYIDMVAGNRKALARYGCPIGTLGAELGKAPGPLHRQTRILFDVFREWLAAQFRELGRTAEAETLALRLLSHTEGISMVAHVYRDPELVSREVDALKQWVAELR